MHMDSNIYHTFGLYSVIQLYIQLIFALILEKLYYEEKNKLANIYIGEYKWDDYKKCTLEKLLLKIKLSNIRRFFYAYCYCINTGNQKAYKG